MLMDISYEIINLKPWLESLCNEVGQEDIANRDWKYKVFETPRLTDEDDDKGRTDFCEGAFQYLEDIGKTMNKRIYIGPGRDGSSDDKIALAQKLPFPSSASIKVT